LLSRYAFFAPAPHRGLAAVKTAGDPRPFTAALPAPPRGNGKLAAPWAGEKHNTLPAFMLPHPGGAVKQALFCERFH